MRALVVPGVGAILEDGRLVPARSSTEDEGDAFARMVRDAVASGRPLVERFDHAFVVEFDRLTDPTTLVDEVRRSKTCRACGVSFDASISTAAYCSDACRPPSGRREARRARLGSTESDDRAASGV